MLLLVDWRCDRILPSYIRAVIMSDNTEQWESRELGTSEEHVRKSTVDAAAVDEALGLKPISIRMQKGMIDDLKAIAALHGVGYQPLIRQILARFIAEADSAMTINNHKAIISYSPQTGMLRGEFIGLHGGADFYAKDIDSLRREGETSLRVYLDMCQGIPPETPRRRSGWEALTHLVHPDVADIELDIPPRSKAQRRPVDFED